jgi:hypothetical protein
MDDRRVTVPKWTVFYSEEYETLVHIKEEEDATETTPQAGKTKKECQERA